MVADFKTESHNNPLSNINSFSVEIIHKVLWCSNQHELHYQESSAVSLHPVKSSSIKAWPGNYFYCATFLSFSYYFYYTMFIIAQYLLLLSLRFFLLLEYRIWHSIVFSLCTFCWLQSRPVIKYCLLLCFEILFCTVLSCLHLGCFVLFYMAPCS